MLDEVDNKLIQALSDDSRISWVQLSEKIHLSASACQRRVDALREQGVITGFTLKTDLKKTGLTIQAFIQIKVERQHIERAEKFRRSIATYPEVLSAYKLSGHVDYLAHVAVEDIDALSVFIDRKLLSLEGVVDANSAIVLDVL